MNQMMTRFVGLMTFSFMLLISFQVSPVSSATGIDTINPYDRQWTTGNLVDPTPFNIGPESREWTRFDKKQVDQLEDDLSKIEEANIVKKTDEAVLVRFDGRVFFDNARARITNEARPALDQVVNVLKDHPDARVTLEGHTNNLSVNTSGFSNNQELSEARARAVSDYLVDRGVSSYRLTAEGYGDSRPLMSNDTERGLERNRRVDFLFRLAD